MIFIATKATSSRNFSKTYSVVMKLLADAQFGVCTFFGLCEETSGDKCGANGLPLTPASIRIIGRFQKLKALDHDYLCKYLDIIRGKYERMYVVSEYHNVNLTEIIQRPSDERSYLLPRVAFQLTSATQYLHQQGIVDRFLCAEHVSFNGKGDLQLSHYGLYHMTGCGVDAPFPIGDPYYFAPEVLAANPRDHHRRSGPKVDVWSLGVILLELWMGCRLCDLWGKNDLKIFFERTLISENNEQERSFLSIVLEEYEVKQCSTLASIDEDMREFIVSCLTRRPCARPSCQRLLEFPFMKKFSMPARLQHGLVAVFLCEDRAANLTVNSLREGVDLSQASMNFPIRSRPIEEVHSLWKLAGSSVETILKKKGLVKTRPPICCIPDVVADEYYVYGHEEERTYLTDLTIIPLSYSNLLERLRTVELEAYYPIIELKYGTVNGDSNANVTTEDADDSSASMEASQLPIVVKERDISYQLCRMVLFHRLVEAYPYKKDLVWKEALVDIPPHYRGYIWAVLLEVRAGDADVLYKSIDKDTPTPTDRQIEVDIPRCHQYDELLSSPEGHLKFKRLLKAWVATNPHYVYWQGLDSLCAPFLHLHFAHEGLAFACLSNFIPKYLHNFFLKDNSGVIQEYLAVSNHLLAFHDPVLYVHLVNIGFTPELYAIPWFLTMFAHVFPLHKLFHLWDTLLLGNSSFPIFVGVSILMQLRNRLLEFGFNECILLFSDMPDVDIEQCVTSSVQLYQRTPVSATFRRHMPPGQQRRRGASFSSFEVDFTGPLGMEPLSIIELKKLHFPRICAHELLLLCGLTGDSSEPGHRQDVLVVDVRPAEEFCRGAFPGSSNIPDAFSTGGFQMPATPSREILQKRKGAITVVIGGKDDHRAIEFAAGLVFGGFPRVCLLNKGIEALKNTNALVVSASA